MCRSIVSIGSCKLTRLRGKSSLSGWLLAPYSYSTDQNMTYIDQSSITSRAWNLRGHWPAENFTNCQREVIFVRDFQFFGLILNENTNFSCRVKFYLIQAVCMCIFHQFCSIFHVFIRIDSSVLSFSTCYIHDIYLYCL